MKIIAAATRDTFIVEMTEAEVVRAAGFSSTYSDAWEKQNGGRALKVGTIINVNAAYTFHARVSENQEKAKSSAGMLRALADMLDGTLPDAVIPPAVTTQPEGGDA